MAGCAAGILARGRRGMGGPMIRAPVPAQYPVAEQRRAWFGQVLRAMATNDEALLRVAQRELWRLGLWVAPVAHLRPDSRGPR